MKDSTDSAFFEEVASKVREATGLSTTAKPGGEVWVDLHDGREIRAKGQGDWSASLFACSGGYVLVPAGKMLPLGVPESQQTVESVTAGIVQAVTQLAGEDT